MIISTVITYTFPPSVPKKEPLLPANILTRCLVGVKAKPAFAVPATLTISTAGLRKQPPARSALSNDESRPGTGVPALERPQALLYNGWVSESGLESGTQQVFVNG